MNTTSQAEKSIIVEDTSLEVADGSVMNAYAAVPEEQGKFPGVIVFQEAFGVNEHIKSVTERFARAGFLAIAPELYHRSQPGFVAEYSNYEGIKPHREAMTDASIIEDIQAVYLWVSKHESIDSNKIASVGFCMGGRVSFLANTVVELKAAISFYGGNIAPSLLDRAEDAHAPLLMFWGGLDKHIDAEQRKSVREALDTAKKSYVDVLFSDADHGFFCDARASYNKKAASQAWVHLHEFLRQNL